MKTWPSVRLVHPELPFNSSIPEEVVAIADEISRLGVPASLFGRYLACSHLEYVVRDEASYICLAVGAGVPHCVRVGRGDLVALHPGSTPVRLVNTSLRAFIDTAIAVTENFPNHSLEDGVEAYIHAAKVVAGIVAAIDPPAVTRHSFWSTLVDDITMGDLACEFVSDAL